MDTKKTARIVQYNAVHPKPRQRQGSRISHQGYRKGLAFAQLREGLAFPQLVKDLEGRTGYTA